jgi:hypothetical protein
VEADGVCRWITKVVDPAPFCGSERPSSLEPADITEPNSRVVHLSAYIEAKCSSETSIFVYDATKCHNPEDFLCKICFANTLCAHDDST